MNLYKINAWFMYGDLGSTSNRSRFENGSRRLLLDGSVI